MFFKPLVICITLLYTACVVVTPQLKSSTLPDEAENVFLCVLPGILLCDDYLLLSNIIPGCGSMQLSFTLAF